MIFEKLKDILNDVVGTVQQTVSGSDKSVFSDYDKKAIADMNKRKEANLKKASKILAKDFSQKAARYRFYMNNNYSDPYNQRQWMELYEKNKSTGDPQALVPMYNAIVTDENTYMIRRGLELVEHRYQQLKPGVNDEISNTFAVEPYTYTKAKYAMAAANRSDAASSVRCSAQADNSLSFAEKKEIEDAKRRYEEAVRNASGYNGSPVLADIYANAEKRAHADYMRVLAKYAGRK